MPIDDDISNRWNTMTEELDEDYAHMVNETGMYRMLYPHMEEEN